MRLYLSLLIFICLIKNTWADEFKLVIASDLVQANSLENVVAEGPSLQEHEQPNDHENAASPRQMKDDFHSKGESDASADTSSSSQASDADASSQQDKAETNAKASSPKPFSSLRGTSQLQQRQKMPRFMASEIDYPVGSMRGGEAEQFFHSRPQSEQNPYASDLFDQLRDQVRSRVGEDIYAKIAGTYSDLQRLDNWLYATMSQYDWFGDQSLSGSQKIVGLNEYLKAEWFFLGVNGSDKRMLVSAQLGSGQANFANVSFDASMSGYASQLPGTDLENRGLFFRILKYLTIMNVIYLMLSVMGGVYLAKAVKFLIRQQDD